MDDSLTRGGQAATVQPLDEVGSSEWPLVSERLDDDRDSALGHLRRDAELPQARTDPRQLSGRRQREEPGVVLASHQVQRSAVQPRDQERPFDGEGPIDVRSGQACASRPDREAGASGILCLHGQDSIDHGLRAASGASAQQLSPQTPANSLRHGPSEETRAHVAAMTCAGEVAQVRKVVRVSHARKRSGASSCRPRRVPACWRARYSTPYTDGWELRAPGSLAPVGEADGVPEFERRDPRRARLDPVKASKLPE